MVTFNSGGIIILWMRGVLNFENALFKHVCEGGVLKLNLCIFDNTSV